ncbi:MAG TPA: SH3 domain-containing protein, partial [Aggregatilineales bacterium]|nr:SH3 domain-containing protein [Aggregatilineales bacterium]
MNWMLKVRLSLVIGASLLLVSCALTRESNPTPTTPPLPVVTEIPTLVPTQTTTPNATATSVIQPTSTSLPPTATLIPPTPAPASTEISIAPGRSGIVAAEGNGLRLRDLPSLNANILDLLPEESTVNIIGRNEDGSWLQVVSSEGAQGWVYAPY